VHRVTKSRTITKPLSAVILQKRISDILHKPEELKWVSSTRGSFHIYMNCSLLQW